MDRHRRPVFKIAINEGLIDGNVTGEKQLFVDGWRNVELTTEEFAAQINLGVAYCAQLRGSRRASNVKCVNVLSVDMDGGRSIEDALADPFISQHLTVFYTTKRHTTEMPRFRLVFRLERTLTSNAEITAATTALTLQLSGDKAATDAARISYGSKGSTPRVFDRYIPDDVLDDLIARGRDLNQRDSKAAGAGPVSTISKTTISLEEPIRTARGDDVAFGDIVPGTNVHCPFHYDREPSAFVLENSGKTAKGLRCMACAQTFWPPGTPRLTYDFFSFEKAAAAVSTFFDKNKDADGLERFMSDVESVREGMTKCNIKFVDSQYLDLASIEPGLTFIKSPKGTGKTEVMSRLANTDSVVLIGHRIALIGQSCKRLDLDNYLYEEKYITSPRLGICLDSLPRLARPLRDGSKTITKYQEYRTVIIDESEQVLSHFLSETMENRDRDSVFAMFRRVLKNAARVIALDADLGWLTFETITKLVNDKPGPSDSSRFFKADDDTNIRRSHLTVNTFKQSRSIKSFESDEDLTDDLLETLSQGKRVFVAANSKRTIDAIYALIEAEFGDRVPAFRITSDNSASNAAQEFVKNIREESLKYRAILASPSMGTGVDIAYDGNLSEIDVVYGYFYPLVTTHFEMDQQISRVRHPSDVRVWVSENRYFFDTALDVIKSDLQKKEMLTGLLLEYDEHRQPVYHTNRAFTDMAALAVSQQRASKNDLRKNFLDHKIAQGFEVDYVKGTAHFYEDDPAPLVRARAMSDGRRVGKILAARTLTKPQLTELKSREHGSKEVTEDERWCMERTFFELFYRQRVEEDAIIDDRANDSRTKLRNYEGLLRMISMRADVRYHEMWSKTDRNTLPELRFLRNQHAAASLAAHLLYFAGIVRDDGVFDTERELSVASLRPFAIEAKKLDVYIQTHLNFRVRSDVKEKPMLVLNRVLDLHGLGCGETRTEVAAGAKTRYYSLYQPGLDATETIAKTRRTTDAWRAVYEINGFDLSELDERDDGLLKGRDRSPNEDPVEE